MSARIQAVFANKFGKCLYLSSVLLLIKLCSSSGGWRTALLLPASDFEISCFDFLSVNIRWSDFGKLLYVRQWQASGKLTCLGFVNSRPRVLWCHNFPLRACAAVCFDGRKPLRLKESGFQTQRRSLAFTGEFALFRTSQLVCISPARNWSYTDWPKSNIWKSKVAKWLHVWCS